MIEHICVECKHIKPLTDNSGRTIYFCMFDQSERYLSEVDFYDNCELDEFAEEVYKNCDMED